MAIESSPNPFEEIAAETRDVAREFGERVQRTVRDWVAVPVEYVGGKIIRSKWGEHPRLETGNLQASIEHREGVDGNVVFTEVTAGAPYADPLENALNRPIMRDVPDEFGDAWAELCAGVVSGDVRGDNEGGV